MPTVEQYRQLLQRRSQQQAGALTMATRTDEATGDDYAQDLAVAQQLGLPPQIVSRNREWAAQQLEDRRVQRLQRVAPQTANWFGASPDRVRLGIDDFDRLSGVERAAVGVADVARSLPGGLIDVIGRPIEAFGDFLARAPARRAAAVEPAIEAHLALLEDENSEFYNPQAAAGFRDRYREMLEREASPGSWMDDVYREGGGLIRDVGSGVRAFGEWVEAPEERQGLHTDIGGGVGQVVGFVAMALVSGGLSAAGMAGTGMSIQSEQLEEAGVDLDSPEAMAGVLAGGAITAITERVGLDRLFRLLPPEGKRRLAGILQRVVVSAGIEGAQEAVEEMGQNIVTAVTDGQDITETEIIRQITDGVPYSAGVGASVGAIVRAVFEMAIPGRTANRISRSVSLQRDVAQQRAEAMQSFFAATDATVLGERSPAVAASHAAEMLRENGSDGLIYVNAGDFRQLFQSDDTIEVTAERWGVEPEELANASITNDIVAIPMDRIATLTRGQPEAQQWFVANGRLDPEQVSLQEAETQAAEIEALAEQGQIPNVMVGDQIAQDIQGQLLAAGASVEEATNAAQLWGAMATTLAERAGVDVQAMWGQIRPLILGPDQEPLVGEEAPAQDEGPATDTLLTRPVGAQPAREVPQAAPATVEDQVVGQPRRVFEQSVSDDPAVAPARTLAEGTRGLFTVSEGGLGDGPSFIRLTESRNLSTFLHESGHFWLEALRLLAAQENATADIKQMWDTVTDWFGTTDLDTAQHEQWARAFEAYLMEGKAPTVGLARVFEAFMTWLVGVYRGIRPSARLSPEIRDVMDRMVATDTEIAIARERASADRVFDPGTMVAQGLATEEEASAYLDVAERARREAKEDVLRSAMQRIRTQRTEQYKELKEKIEAEVTADINGRQDYRALEFLANGVWLIDPDNPPPATKLSKGAVERDYPGELQRLPGPNGRFSTRHLWTTKKDGVHPDIAAQRLGYQSGQEMFEALARLQMKRDDAIRLETERRLNEVVADPSTTGRIEQEALNAVHRNSYAHQLELELRALGKAVEVEDAVQEAAAGTAPRSRQGMAPGQRRRVTSRQMAREAARRMISRMRVDQGSKPGRFLQGEARAARAAAVAAAEGNFPEAFRQKQQQLLQHALYMEAKEVEAEVGRGLDLVRAVRRQPVRQRLGQDYVDQIDAILEGYQFKPKSQRRLRSMKGLLVWYERMVNEGRADELAIPAAVLQEAEADRDHPHYTTLDVTTFRGVMSALRNLRHLGLMKDKLQKKRERKRVAELGEEIADQVEQVGRHRDVPIGARTRGQQVGEFFRDTAAALLKVDALLRINMDGGQDQGPAQRHLKAPIDAAILDNVERQDRAAVELEALFDVYRPAEKRAMDAKVINVTLGGRTHRMSKWDVIALALNWGNADNKDRVVSGENTSEREVWAIFDSVMTPKDWLFAQSVWDHVDGYWGEISDLQRRMTGLDPKKVEAEAVVHPVTGDILAKGGYYPIAYDPQRGTRAADLLASDEALQTLPPRRAMAQTRHGHTEARMSSVQGRPLRYDIGVLFSHVQGVIYDLTMREAVLNVGKVLNSKEVRGALDQSGQTQLYQALKLWLQDVADGEQAPQHAAARLLRRLRTGYTTASLGFNLGTTALQLTGLFQTAVDLGYRDTFTGMMDALNPGKWSFAHDNSRQLQQRDNTFHRDIHDTVRQIRTSRAGQALRSMQQVAFWAMAKMQMVVDTATWLAAYKKAMRELKDHDQSVVSADRALVRSQGSGIWSDRTAFERGTISAGVRRTEFVRLWGMFYTYFGAKLSVMYERIGRTDFKDPLQIARLAMDMVTLFVAESMAILLVRNWGDLDGDDETPFWWDMLRVGGREGLASAIGMVPIAREFYSAYQGFSGGGSVGAVGDQFGGVMTQIEQGEGDRAFWRALSKAAGTVFAIPGVNQANRLIDAVLDYRDEGELQAPLQPIFGRPIQ